MQQKELVRKIRAAKLKIKHIFIATELVWVYENKHMGKVLLLTPFYRQGSWGSNKLSNLSKVMSLTSGWSQVLT